MRAPLLALVALLAVGLAAGESLAARPVPLMVLPFAPEGPAHELGSELELELELSEGLVLSSPRALYDELDEREIAEMNPERVADALAILEQQALVYGVLQDDALVVVLFRTNDAALVWAERLPLSAGREEGKALATGLLKALGALHEQRRLSDEELVKVGLRPRAPQVEEPPVGDVGELTAGSEDEAAPEKARDDTSRDEALPLAGLDRLGRVQLAWTPSLLHYRACQPADKASYAPFSCAPAPGVPSTEVSVLPTDTLLGGAAALAIYPLSFVGLEASASLFTATLLAKSGGEALARLSPNPFRTTGGDLTTALVLRLPFGDEALAGSVGARAGYHLGWAMTEDVRLDVGGQSLLFPLLPEYFGHHGLLGLSSAVALGDALRLSLDVDGLLGTHLEGPTQVGNDPLAVGGRSRFGVELHVGAGFLLTALLEGSATSVKTSGVVAGGARFTRALEPFDSGQLFVADARFGIGVGYRY